MMAMTGNSFMVFILKFLKKKFVKKFSICQTWSHVTWLARDLFNDDVIEIFNKLFFFHKGWVQ